MIRSSIRSAIRTSIRTSIGGDAVAPAPPTTLYVNPEFLGAASSPQGGPVGPDFLGHTVGNIGDITSVNIIDAGGEQEFFHAEFNAEEEDGRTYFIYDIGANNADLEIGASYRLAYTVESFGRISGNNTCLSWQSAGTSVDVTDSVTVIPTDPATRDVYFDFTILSTVEGTIRIGCGTSAVSAHRMIVSNPRLFKTVDASPPVFVDQPQDVDGYEDERAEMTVSTISNTPVTYQWQYLSSVAGWTDITNPLHFSGWDTDTLVFEDLTRFYDGLPFRCHAQNLSGSDNSEEATCEVIVDESLWAIWADDNGSRIGWEDENGGDYGFAFPIPDVVTQFFWNTDFDTLVVYTDGNQNGEVLRLNMFEFGIHTLPWTGSNYSITDAALVTSLANAYASGRRFFRMDSIFLDIDIPVPRGHFNEKSFETDGAGNVTRWNNLGSAGNFDHTNLTGNIYTTEVNGLTVPYTNTDERGRIRITGNANRQFTGGKTFFAVYVPNVDATAGDMHFLDAASGSSNRMMGRITGGNTLVTPSNTGEHDGSPTDYGDVNIAMYCREDAGSNVNTYRENNSAEVTTTGGHGNTNVGSLFADSSGNREFYGAICEIIMFDEELDEDQRNYVWDLLEAKWTT